MTNDLVRRVWEHRENVVEGFTQKYDIHRLVYFEQFNNFENAIRREKQLKKWNRSWKIQPIQENNPNWDDLYPGIASHNAPSCPRRRASSNPCRAYLDESGGYWIVRLRGR